MTSLQSVNAQYSEAVDSLYKDYMKENTPGIAVSVLKDTNVLYQKGFGMASLEYGIPITEKTKFHVASLAKQFTAFMILKLEDEGVLSIKDDIRKYIPELPDYGHTITLHHLLTHSSGIRDQWRLLEMAGWRLDDVIKTEQIFKLIISQEELNFIPGKKYMYSNSGYTLLALVIERITNMSFAEYAKQTIFDPLKMDDSFFYDDHEGLIQNRAYSYQKEGSKLKKSNLNFATVGPTSLFTTIEDMNKWAVNFHTQTIGNKRIFKTMNQNEGNGYAKGQFIRNYKGLKMIYHSGSDAGYRLYFARFPELGYSFSVFANASYINAYEEIFKLIDHYLFNEFEKKDKSEASKKIFNYKEDLFVSMPTEQLKKFEGRFYDNESSSFWTVTLKKDTLYCSGSLIPEPIPLYPVGKNNFKVKGTPYDVSVNFIENDYNKPVLEFKIPNLMWLWLEKEMTVAASNYLGSYYNAEVDAQYELVEKNDEIYLVHKKLDDIKLIPIHDSFFTSKNRNFIETRFEKDDTGRIASFTISNESIKEMTFKRR